MLKATSWMTEGAGTKGTYPLLPNVEISGIIRPMADMKITLPGADTITLSGQTVEKLLRNGDGDAALLYLYILKTRGQSSSREAEVALDKSTGWVASAMAALSRMGLIECAENTPQAGASPETTNATRGEPREYTSDEISRELLNGSDFSAIVDEAQRQLGKILSPNDLTRLFGIYDHLRLPPEVIMELITHCISESGRSGSGRLPSMTYIEKAAYTWEREGIFSLERTQEYLKALEARRGVYGEMKLSLQIKGRELSKSEQRYVDAWVEMGFKSDAVEIAYDRTMLKTGKLAWGYMDSIIKSWYGKGLLTPDDIKAKDTKSPPPRGNGAAPPSQKFGAADSEELERMQRLLDKLKEG